MSSGDLVLEREDADIAAKKLALETAAAAAAGVGLLDRIRVAPSEPMEDGATRDLVCNALVGEPALAPCRILARVKRASELLQDPPNATGWIEVRVEDGVVTLDGELPGLVLKRLAGVLAWWIPGSRDVVNGIGVVPLESDNDAEITDAVAVVLEKDPFVNASQIRVETTGAVVTLHGAVRSEEERRMAEHDAWYTFGVDKVVNRLLVRP
jgi:osmotically-inducible protein OsmY